MRTIPTNLNSDEMIAAGLRNLHELIHDGWASLNFIQKIVHSYCGWDAISECIGYSGIIHNYRPFISIS